MKCRISPNICSIPPWGILHLICGLIGFLFFSFVVSKCHDLIYEGQCEKQLVWCSVMLVTAEVWLVPALPCSDSWHWDLIVNAVPLELATQWPAFLLTFWFTKWISTKMKQKWKSCQRIGHTSGLKSPSENTETLVEFSNHACSFINWPGRGISSSFSHASEWIQ